MCIRDSGEWVPTLRRGHDDWQAMLAAVATLWTHGVSLDRRGGEPTRARRVVGGLPTYPFERERHWVEPPPRPQADDATPAGAFADSRCLLYTSDAADE